MIEFKGVSKIYYSARNPVYALSDTSFEIEKGAFVCIVGKSGAGKTTLIKLLIAEEKPSSGEIIFQQENIQLMSSGDLQAMRRKIGVVHQDYKLLSSKTVRENLEYVMQVIGASAEDIQRDIPQVLEIVELSSREENFPQELSGGERQRLAIARALCHRPEVVLADEPTGNLDLYSAWNIINLFKKIHKLGTTIILATHNKEVIDKLNKRVLTLENGRIIRDDPEGKFIL